MKTNTTKGLAVALSAALVLSVTVVPADAKAKKPSVSTTKVSVKVGATKKVTVKNATKVTWTIDKAGKKVVSLSKTSKKGATIKGKKAGSAKVTAAMKYGKKTLKKTIKVTVKGGTAPVVTQKPDATAIPTPDVTATPEPTATPTPDPNALPPVQDGWTRTEVDLSQSGTAAEYYDATSKSVKIKNLSWINFDLPEELSDGDELVVHLRGVDKGENGFRTYIVSGQDTCSNAEEIAKSIEDEEFVKAEDGSFKWDISFSIIDSTSGVCVKGITYADNVEDLEITSVTFDIKKA